MAQRVPAHGIGSGFGARESQDGVRRRMSFGSVDIRMNKGEDHMRSGARNVANSGRINARSGDNDCENVAPVPRARRLSNSFQPKSASVHGGALSNISNTLNANAASRVVLPASKIPKPTATQPQISHSLQKCKDRTWNHRVEGLNELSARFESVSNQTGSTSMISFSLMQIIEVLETLMGDNTPQVSEAALRAFASLLSNFDNHRGMIAPITLEQRLLPLVLLQMSHQKMQVRFAAESALNACLKSFSKDQIASVLTRIFISRKEFRIRFLASKALIQILDIANSFLQGNVMLINNFVHSIAVQLSSKQHIGNGIRVGNHRDQAPKTDEEMFHEKCQDLLVKIIQIVGMDQFEYAVTSWVDEDALQQLCFDIAFGAGLLNPVDELHHSNIASQELQHGAHEMTKHVDINHEEIKQDQVASIQSRPSADTPATHASSRSSMSALPQPPPLSDNANDENDEDDSAFYDSRAEIEDDSILADDHVASNEVTQDEAVEAMNNTEIISNTVVAPLSASKDSATPSTTKKLRGILKSSTKKPRDDSTSPTSEIVRLLAPRDGGANSIDVLREIHDTLVNAVAITSSLEESHAAHDQQMMPIREPAKQIQIERFAESLFPFLAETIKSSDPDERKLSVSCFVQLHRLVRKDVLDSYMQAQLPPAHRKLVGLFVKKASGEL